MKTHLLLCGVLAIFVKAVLVTGDDDVTVLADNKCLCTRVTSRLVPNPEDPTENIVERSIRIVVPLNNRENISDPDSPVRRNFVYHLSEVCKKCDPVEVELGDNVVTATQSNLCNDDSGVPETCYMYDRNKCYTTVVPLIYHGEIKKVQAALTPDSCYPD